MSCDCRHIKKPMTIFRPSPPPIFSSLSNAINFDGIQITLNILWRRWVSPHPPTPSPSLRIWHFIIPVSENTRKIKAETKWRGKLGRLLEKQPRMNPDRKTGGQTDRQLIRTQQKPRNLSPH